MAGAPPLGERFLGLDEDGVVGHGNALPCAFCATAIGYPAEVLDDGFTRHLRDERYVPTVAPEHASLLRAAVEEILAGGQDRFVLDFECPTCGAPCAPVFERVERFHHHVYAAVAVVDADAWPDPRGARVAARPPGTSLDRRLAGRPTVGRAELRSRELPFPMNVLVGAPLLLLGVGAAWATAAAVANGRGVSGGSFWAGLLLAVALVPLGLASLVSRHAALFDGDARRITIAWGKPWPLRKRTYAFEDFSGVSLVVRQRLSKPGRPTYGVRVFLVGDDARVLVAAKYAHGPEGGEALADRVSELTGLQRV